MSVDTISTQAWVRQIMGMPISIHVRAMRRDRIDVADAVDRVFGHLEEVDAVFSMWRSDSEVMRRRRGDPSAVGVHPWMGEVHRLCEIATHETNGLFTTDLTGPDGSRGWDPTGLVKGWALDTAAVLLREVDGIAFSINAGGDVVCGLGADPPEAARPWRVGIEDPLNRTRIAHVVSITDGAVATSGTAARGAHIVDPRSGEAVGRTGSVTVLGPELVWADVWATTTFIDPTALEKTPSWSRYRLLDDSGRHFR